MLYRRRQGSVYRFALEMTGSRALAEEVTQEVFLMLIQNSTTFDPARGSLRNFLYGVARNYVRRILDRERPYAAALDEDSETAETGSASAQFLNGPEALADPLADLTQREAVANVRQAVLSLPARYREVVVLCDLHERDYVETAEALGCAVGTVRSRLHRARELLFQKLASFREKSAGLGAGVK